MKLLRLPDVEQKTAMRKSTIYKKIKQGLFPMPVKLGPKISAWVESDIDTILEAYIRNQDSNYIKSIVSSLNKQKNQS